MSRENANSKRIVICGASGLVGARLYEVLEEKGHEVSVVGRNPRNLQSQFPGASHCLSWDEFSSDQSPKWDVIINLAGAGVMDRKWSEDYKKIMTASRVDSTRACSAIVSAHPETHLINASAVHAYGIYLEDHEPFQEGDEPRSDSLPSYLHTLITEWEAAAQPAIEAGASVALIRLGVVLDASGGALEGLLPLFRKNLGGRQGSGRQIMPWISLDDVVSGLAFLVERPDIVGPVNFVAPSSCSNKRVMQALSKALGRPCGVPMLSSFARLVMGEAASELVLAGQRVEPKVLLENGYSFVDQEIEPCLERLLQAK